MFGWRTAFMGTILFLILCLVKEPGGQGARSAPPKPNPPDATAALAQLEEQFIKGVWGSMQESGCLTCHLNPKRTPLPLSQNPRATFRLLLEGGYLDPDDQHSLLARLSHSDDDKRMPPSPRPRWSPAQVERVRAFSKRVQETLAKLNLRLDEIFPLSLRLPYEGTSPQGMDNTFLSDRQLRGKIKTIFGDEWKRDERDLFAENIALFGGADFRRYFSETNRPTAQFLTGLDMLARDVASRAYVQRTGPFQNFPTNLPDPLTLKTPDKTYREAINRLYNRLLFRNATETEIQQAFKFLQRVYRARENLTPEQYDLQFELTVRDTDGLSTTRSFTLTVLNTPYKLYQELINEEAGGQGDKETKGQAEHILGQPVTLRAGDKGQMLRLTNANTYGAVSIVGIKLKGPLPKEKVKEIKVSDPGVQLEGAWRKDGNAYHDNDENKGNSHVLFPLAVEESGRYEITVLYRHLKNRYMAQAVPVEVLCHDQHRLALEPLPPTPPKGESRWWIDQTVDTIPYWESKTVFRFNEPGQGVEINNTGTRKEVVADAVRFVPISPSIRNPKSEIRNPNEGQGKAGGTAPPDFPDAPVLLVRANEAEGNENWKPFDHKSFEAYNTIGPQLLSDKNERKGELRLLYKPSSQKGWRPDRFYTVQVTYPAKEFNETRTPLIIRANASSPIVRVRYPVRAHVGAKVPLDASACYNVQGTPLQFSWRQTSGPRVQLSSPSGASIAFIAPPLTPHQAAWEGLCRALMKHPDFLFTRPPSLATLKDPRDRQRLQLVKIAQDLVGRPPTQEELAQLGKRVPLSKLVDQYLHSAEFREFYFRRIRLLLESHGTEEDDEPVRLWCYVAFNDRPFSEILTADYTVDTKMQRQSRPAYYGKTGLLTMKGFIKGKPGLPHFNYPAVVAEKFLGYVFEVPPEIVKARMTATAAATTQPGSVCYSCHKILTPLAYQRLRWTDDGMYREKEEGGRPIDDSDRGAVASYPFKGQGMEAFATQAVKKERFIRTMINTHFLFLFGREMRWNTDERALYHDLWDKVHQSNFTIRALLKAMVLHPRYLDGAISRQPSAIRKTIKLTAVFADG